MVLTHVWGLFTNPKQEWQSIRDEDCTSVACYMSSALMLAAVPAVAGFVGATQIGWTPGQSSDTVYRMTTGSALQISIATYIAVLVAIYVIGRAVHWMAVTYGVENPEEGKCIRLVAYVATPLLLIGLIGFFPSLWVYAIGILFAIGYSVYLLYSGLPVVLSLPQDRGFFFSSAVLTVAMVVFIGLLISTVLLWGFGMEPVFIR